MMVRAGLGSSFSFSRGGETGRGQDRSDRALVTGAQSSGGC